MSWILHGSIVVFRISTLENNFIDMYGYSVNVPSDKMAYADDRAQSLHIPYLL